MKDCNQCGKCCTKYADGGLSVSAEEIALWEIFKPDIARYASHGEIWISPETGEQLQRCPWLRQVPKQNKFTCGIYLDRPDDCKFYPVTVQQMQEDECEMLEVKDLRKPKQAQKTLDKIMADSRPPYLSENYK
ncbi:MAG: YkgJ family cysteine cluster protein [Pseudohongiella sp.]|nr:YkgJ family cysteine cluster protein [Pseudohongiella sp.]